MKQYQMYELIFQGEEPKGSHVDIELTGTFSINGNETTVKGFYAGDGQYKIRFLPVETGVYDYRISGLFEKTGTVECISSSQAHGRVVAEDTHFRYEDGMTYIPIGTTVYALVHQPETLIAQTMESLSSSPFNKVRLCVFPKDTPYSRNEPELYPFEKNHDSSWDVSHPSFGFWNHLEEQIFKLGNMGIETDLILFHPYDRWGFSALTMEENQNYLDYLLRRFSAIPHLWWSLANEHDLLFSRTEEDWYQLEKYVVDNDPFNHLISNHNCIKYYDYARENITHCSMQTIAIHMADKWMHQYRKPVVFDECCYEGNIEYDWGNISGFEMSDRFWQAYSKGAFASHGETFYSEDEILWWAKGGTLKGKSVSRIAYLKQILYALPGPLEPWSERDFIDMNNLGEDNQMQKFVDLMMSISDVDRTNLDWKSPAYSGRYGSDVFLKYYSHQCSVISSISLPNDAHYRIDLIDTWNMTRTTLHEKVNGTVSLRLPGREGIAVLAQKV